MSNVPRGRWLTACALSAGLFAFSACAPADDTAADDTADAMADDDAMATDDAMAGGDGPEANAEAVWTYLTDNDYTSWPLWPGKTEKYEGTQPHGALLTTYVNPAAQQALSSGAAEMPVGAIIVKENFMPDGTHAASTVMYKVAGLDPEHNNWWYLKRNADGSIDAEGIEGQALRGCIGCHSGKADNDYIFTSELGGAN